MMIKLIVLFISVLVSLSVIWLQPASAQQTGFTTCYDDSGKAYLCVGEIPESEIEEPNYRRIPGERGCGSFTAYWGNNGNNEVPGINPALVKMRCRDNRTIVVWADVELSLFSGNRMCGSANREITVAEGWGFGGEIENDPCISYKFEVLNSGGGNGDINGMEFDLSDGDVFLISTAGGVVTVRQIDYDFTSVSAPDIQLLARRYPEIRSFFEGQVQ